jgi:hypothetical protein
LNERYSILREHFCDKRAIGCFRHDSDQFYYNSTEFFPEIPISRLKRCTKTNEGTAFIVEVPNIKN